MGGGFGLVDVFCHSAHKADKCKASLCRNDAVAAALEALCSCVEVQSRGHPMRFSTNIGLSLRESSLCVVLFFDAECWGKPWLSGDDSGPGRVGWAWGEKTWTAKSAVLICGSLGCRVPSTMGGLLLCSITWAFGVGQLAACSRMFGPIFPLL